jgi:histidinol-phosphate aminotransferase
MTQDRRNAAPFARAFETLLPFVAGPHARDPRDVQRLALSENPYGPSVRAIEAASREIWRMQFYPNSDNEPLRTNLARFYDVDRDAVVVGNGLDNVILALSLATRVAGRHTVVTADTFLDYRNDAELIGQEAVTVPLRSVAIDIPAVLDAMDGAGAVFVCNPHNPTASALDAAAVDALVLRARETGALLVLDEAYAEFAHGAFPTGLRHIAGGSVVVLRTFSKAYGLAGVRVGYAIGDPRVIAAMLTEHHAEPYVVNRVGLAAAVEALDDQDHLRRVVDANARTRMALITELHAREIATRPSQANFVLARLGAPVIARLAHDHGIHVLHASALGYPDWARMTVPHSDWLGRLMTALDDARDQTGDSSND